MFGVTRRKMHKEFKSGTGFGIRDLESQMKKKKTIRFCYEEIRDPWVNITGSRGWGSDESARLPPLWPGFDSRSWRHMWFEFLEGSRSGSESPRVFLQVLRFSSLH